jgi:sec-independent protein translocase protein TatC
MEKAKSEMSLLGHIEALRAHLWRAAIAIAIGAVTAFVFTRTLFDNLIFGPYRSGFITRRVFCKIADHFGIENLCLSEIKIQVFQEITMSGQFIWHIWAALIFGFILAFPYVVWEIWRFIKPALMEKEIKSVRGITFYISVLFFFGVFFGYFFLAPITVNFLGNYTISDFIEKRPTFNSYISTILNLTLGTGLVFQLPIFMYFLAKLGVVSAGFLKTYRRHAYVVILILSAIVTPPDIASQILIFFPLMFLYEISIWVARRVENNRLKAEAGN